jgi:hypothetical protein
MSYNKVQQILARDGERGSPALPALLLPAQLHSHVLPKPSSLVHLSQHTSPPFLYQGAWHACHLVNHCLFNHRGYNRENRTHMHTMNELYLSSHVKIMRGFNVKLCAFKNTLHTHRSIPNPVQRNIAQCVDKSSF